MSSYSIGEFFLSVNGEKLLQSFLGRGFALVPAWADPDDGHRLKMAWAKSRATKNAAEIIQACKGRPGALAVIPPGVAVLDLDVKGSVNGWVWLAENLPGWIPTRGAVRTPSGSAHVYLKADGIRSHPAHAPGVDVFGPGSLITMPGSRSARGAYTPPADFAFARASKDVLEVLPRARVGARVGVGVQRYTGGARAALRAFAVKLAAPGADASNISGRLNRAAFCSGRWSDEISIDDLTTLVDIAVEYGMDEAIAWSTADKGHTSGRLVRTGTVK